MALYNADLACIDVEALKAEIMGEVDTKLEGVSGDWEEIMSHTTTEPSAYTSAWSINETIDFSDYKEIKIRINGSGYANEFHEGVYLVEDIIDTSDTLFAIGALNYFKINRSSYNTIRNVEVDSVSGTPSWKRAVQIRIYGRK